MELAQLEKRIAHLEAQQGTHRRQRFLAPTFAVSAAGLLALALSFAFQGLGPPNHPYQWAMGALATALAYHRGWLRLTRAKVGLLLPPTNAVVLAHLFKLFIGSGRQSPFAWLRLPEVQSAPTSGKWYDVVPQWKVAWVAPALAGFEVDFTILQTFLLLLTLIGALFRFQPFASLTAFLLLLVSLPALTSFHWPFVFPALACAAVGLYLQGEQSAEDILR